jgi:steroid 5-alpha reductase family enzyme
MATLQRVRSAADIALAELDRSDLIPTVQGAIRELTQMRLTITAAVVAWGLWISWRLYNSDTQKQEDDKFIRMHQIWFGNRALFETLFNAWATSVVIAIIMRAALKWFRPT